MDVSIQLLEAAGLAALGAGATAAAEAVAAGSVINLTVIAGVALAAAVGKLLPAQLIQANSRPSQKPRGGEGA